MLAKSLETPKPILEMPFSSPGRTMLLHCDDASAFGCAQNKDKCNPLIRNNVLQLLKTLQIGYLL